MYKLILFSILIIGSASWAVSNGDDSLDGTAAVVANGKDRCACDIKADNNTPAGTVPPKIEAEKQMATLFGAGTVNSDGTSKAVKDSDGG